MMKRHLTHGVVVTVCLCAAPVVSAHHSHQRFYDWCKTVTFEGRIARVEWKNPHSLVHVDADDGTTYHVEMTSAQILARQYDGSPPDALSVGVRVRVTAHPIRDGATIGASFPELQGDPVPNTVDPVQIRRVDNTFNWSVQPSGSPSDCEGR